MSILSKEESIVDFTPMPIPSRPVPERLPRIAPKPLHEAAADWGQQVLDLQNMLEASRKEASEVREQLQSTCATLVQTQAELRRVTERADHYQRLCVKVTTRVSDMGELALKILKDVEDAEPTPVDVEKLLTDIRRDA